jgi:hypothetical protein
MDGPEEIVEGALSHHVRMINEFKGVPGVKPDRLAEGMQVIIARLNLPMHTSHTYLCHIVGMQAVATLSISSGKTSRKCLPVASSHERQPGIQGCRLLVTVCNVVGCTVLVCQDAHGFFSTGAPLCAVASGRANNVPGDQPLN